MHAIRLQDDGGDATLYSAEDGETILLALRRQGVVLPASCEAGECGTCKVALISGKVQELDYDPWALDDDLRARGIVLACRSTVWGDISIRRLRALEPERVLGARVLAHHAQTLLLQLEAGAINDADAGASVALELGSARGLDARIARVAGREIACELSPAARSLVHEVDEGQVVVLRLRG